ncbi:MAG: stage II sporulation protein M [Syntrophomonadaceae bacterium]
MREVTFLKKNAEMWKSFETLLDEKDRRKDPDLLAGLFIQLTDDLSYARTFYPGSRTLLYLNSLTAKAHRSIYRNKKEDKSGIVKFWTTELPLLFYKHRLMIFISSLIFIVSLLIGIVSAANDSGFTRVIMGDSYVKMTEENIDKGDPMSVYKKMNETDMFLGITLNNIKVSFFAFVMGILFSFGTGYILFTNGVMLGAFEYFFYEHNYLFTSITTVFVHGVLEISSIIIAGAAGLLLGKSFLMPGTYSRRESFMNAARDGVKIVIGLIPLFITAGFFESFVTRHTEMPLVVNLLIIISSIVFIIWYTALYPKRVKEGIERKLPGVN